MKVDTTVYCSLNENHTYYSEGEIKNEDNIICRSCYDNLQQELDDEKDNSEQLRDEIKSLESYIDELEEFKQKVIDSNDCPIWVRNMIVAEKL